MSITRVQDPTTAHPDYIADLIHESYAGPAWHGPCVVEALAGVDAEAATKRISPHGIRSGSSCSISRTDVTC